MTVTSKRVANTHL